MSTEKRKGHLRIIPDNPAEERRARRPVTRPVITLPPDPNPDRTTRIYILHMEATEYYKIGISKDVRSRIGTIQNGSPMRVNLFWASACYLSLRDARAIERTAHMTHAAHKSKAPTQREWFHFSPAEARQVARALGAAVSAFEKEHRS